MPRVLSATARPSTRWLAATAVAALAVVLAGLSAAPARSASDGQCPQAFPTASLTKGQAVTGLTVSTGTTPEGFTGTVLGVLDDGIMPGLDMILVRLSSPEIERVGGIWFGMSGSPVYAADGRLIGAVSYGLSFGPSPVAGVTPAADMLELLADGASTRRAELPSRVALPDGLAARMIERGDVTPAEADGGMAQLELPFGIAGVSRQRLRAVAKVLDLDTMRLMRVGTTRAADGASSTPVAGGNLAASISYGDITAAGIGTATAVCGRDVLAFGHPMLWTGPTSLTMHGADALFVQDDPIFSPFKLANIGAPIGTVTQDRMPGIVGAVGPLPPTSDVTSAVTSEQRSRTGTTHISLDDWVPELAFVHLLVTMDRVFDGIGKGSGTVGWTLRGTREDGRSFTLARDDLYADPRDLTWGPAWDLYVALATLEFNGVEDITLDDVDAKANLARRYDHFTMTGVQVRRGGRWSKLDDTQPLRLRAGQSRAVRVTLTSAETGPTAVVVQVPVPRGAAGRFGTLDVFGGNSGLFGEAQFFDEPAPGLEKPTVDELLADIAGQPHNNDVVVDLTFFNDGGDVTYHRGRRTAMKLVVDGGLSVPVQAIR